MLLPFMWIMYIPGTKPDKFKISSCPIVMEFNLVDFSNCPFVLYTDMVVWLSVFPNNR